MRNMGTLYDKLNKGNKTQLKERSLLYPNVGKKVKRILQKKSWVIDLTVGEVSDMNGIITRNGEWLDLSNIYGFFENEK